MHVDRRVFLGALVAGGAVAAFGAGVLVPHAQAMPAQAPVAPRGFGQVRPRPSVTPTAIPLPRYFNQPSGIVKRPTPGGQISALPGDGRLIALTVDDGGSSECVALYAKFIAQSGFRVTFFLNGSLSAWTDNADALRPLVASGQVQLANHTWTHTDLTTISDDAIRADLKQNDDFIRSMYGVEAKPYFRPPFGKHDARVDAAAASIGYTVPVLWYGSLSDSTEIADSDLMSYAVQYLLPQSIVIGHANWLTVTRHFNDIADIINSRGLVPVTLDDVWERP